jgi:hypothetical protein
MTLPKNLHIYVGLSALLILIILPEHYFSTKPDDISFCIHVRTFGIECPGCGFTRATYNFLHLNFKKAISLNPTVIFIFPIIATETLNLIKENKLVKKLKYITYVLFIISLFFLYLERIFNH